MLQPLLRSDGYKAREDSLLKCLRFLMPVKLLQVGSAVLWEMLVVEELIIASVD